MCRIFISYSSEETALANNVKNALESRGFSCWIALRSISKGGDYAQEIPAAITSCDVFLLLLTEKSQQSNWVPKELDYAITKGKTVIPLHLDDSAISDPFYFRLTNIQMIEAKGRWKDAIEELVAQLCGPQAHERASEQHIRADDGRKRSLRSGVLIGASVALTAVLVVALGVMALNGGTGLRSQTAEPTITAAPTAAPTEALLESPTTEPTEAPTVKASDAPTTEPTEAPTVKASDAPTTEPTEAPTAAPTEAPRPIAFHAPSLEEDGTLLLTWTDDAGRGPYRVTYEQLTGAVSQRELLGASGLTGNGMALDTLVPGVSYRLRVYDAAGNVDEWLYEPSSKAFSDFRCGLQVDPRLRTGGGFAEKQYFLASSVTAGLSVNEYCVNAVMTYPTLRTARSYSYLISLQSPEGLTVTVKQGRVAMEAGGRQTQWRNVSLNEAFALLAGENGAVPAGNYVLTVFFDGQAAASAPLEVR